MPTTAAPWRRFSFWKRCREALLPPTVGIWVLREKSLAPARWSGRRWRLRYYLLGDAVLESPHLLLLCASVVVRLVDVGAAAPSR
jgi:hypothetical protein